MNKTEQVSIGRKGFVCDLDAYRILQMYLERSEKALGSDPDKKEIMADLELAMAAHLEEISAGLVVDKATAENVIQQMGEVEPASGNETSEEDTDTPEGKKSLLSSPIYKDKSRAVLDGVCAGIARALGIDPLWVRIAALVLTAITQGFGVVLYLVLSFIMTDDKESAKRSANEIVSQIKDKTSELVQASRPYERILRGVVVAFAKAIWWILRLSIGLLLLLLSMSWVSTLVYMVSNIKNTDILGRNIGFMEFGLAISLGLVLLVPLFELLVAMIPSNRPKKPGLMLAGWSVWVLALIAAVGFGANALPKLYDDIVRTKPQNRFVYVEDNDGEKGIEHFCFSPFGTCGPRMTYTTSVSICDKEVTTFMTDDLNEWKNRGWSYYEVIDPGIRDQATYCRYVKELLSKYEHNNLMFRSENVYNSLNIQNQQSESSEHSLKVEYMVLDNDNNTKM